jgi:cyclic pyranopterin phosphate synthase
MTSSTDIKRPQSNLLTGPPPDILEAPPESLLRAVEIEVGSRCNRHCSYCPVSLERVPGVPEFMSSAVFEAVISSLMDISFSGRLSYHFYNEPLLRRDLEALVAKARSAVPGALQVLYTNGDRLDDARYASLRSAGIDWFIVTLHSRRAFPERPFQLVKRPEDLQLSNRGGRLAKLPGPKMQHLSTPCFAPIELCVVTVTGDVVLCCEDSERTEVFGNVLESSLKAILSQPRLIEIRHALIQGRRLQGADICGRCTNVAHARAGLSEVEEPGLARTAGSIDAQTLKVSSERARMETEGARTV